ncbi:MULTISPECIES: DUF1654 domain-containing protein [unclassified Pseudomonas]|uniref:DUF1654 domain-containing protein n=1 Tax=unclassified Pseudomonas TaxID=196821 RepID=UPI003DA8AB92
MTEVTNLCNAEGRRLNGMERLGLRVSSMINHPVAQIRRWVTIHRLDRDSEQDWDEIMGLLSETDGIDMTYNDDGSVTLRWEPSCEGDSSVVIETEEDLAPF